MKRLYGNRRVGDIGFSRNGWAALKRGEKPHHMWTGGERIGPTKPHHIEVPFRAGGDQVQRKLVMFYRIMKDADRI